MTSDNVSNRGYKTKRDTANITSTGGTIDLATVSNQHDSVVTGVEIEVTSRPQDTFKLSVRDTASANDQDVKHYIGATDDSGTLDAPIAETGADKEWSVRNVTSTNSGVGYAVNLEVQERDPN